MPWYAVQDSDWDWECGDGDAIIVQADSPELAVREAYSKSRGFGGGDGIHCKVAEINLVGFLSGGREMGSPWQWDEYQPINQETDR